MNTSETYLAFVNLGESEFQRQKCESCEHQLLQGDEDGWCYMFPEMVIRCHQYKHLTPH